MYARIFTLIEEICRRRGRNLKISVDVHDVPNSLTDHWDVDGVLVKTHEPGAL